MPCRRLRFSLTIAWLTMLIVACRVSNIDAARRRRAHRLKPEDDFSSMVERNREAIGSLFAGAAGRDRDATTARMDSSSQERASFYTGLTTAGTVSSHIDMKRLDLELNRERAAKKSLLSMPGPDILQDTDNMIDSESNSPHRRVKRITDSSDPHSQKNPNRSKKSIPAYTRRAYPKVFKRFSPEETNPADENEADYSNAFDEADVDVADGAYLNDELTRKRNSLEDVYPEVTDSPKQQERYVELSGQVHDTARRKRDKSTDEEEEEEEEEEVPDAEAEGDCAENEEVDEYYYDNEEPERSKARNEKRASEHDDAADLQALAVDRESENLRNTGQNAIEQDYLRFPGKAEREAAIKERAIAAPPSEQEVRGSKNAKSNILSERRITKEKTKMLKPKPISKNAKRYKQVPNQMDRSDRLAKVQKEEASLRENAVGCAEENEGSMGRVKCSTNKKLVAKAGKERQDNLDKSASKDQEARYVKPPSIGEVKDLMGKLIVKVEDLQNLVSELKVSIEQPQALNDKMMRSNFPVDSRKPRGSSHQRCLSLWSN